MTTATIEATPSIVTHNGKWTIKNPITQAHRTFEVRTARKGGLKGKRIVAVMAGSDNMGDFQGFGFVEPNGSITLWRKWIGTKKEQYARMIENMQTHEENGNIEVHHEGKCRRCNKTLTNPISIELGIGPHCLGQGG